MKEYKKLEVETFEELQKLIDKADYIDEMNNLREATVKFMNEGHPEILKLWQDKYWNLKKCPTCGRLR